MADPIPLIIDHPYALMVLERRATAAGCLRQDDALNLIKALREAWDDLERLESGMEAAAELSRVARIQELERAGAVLDKLAEQAEDAAADLAREAAALEAD